MAVKCIIFGCNGVLINNVPPSKKTISDMEEGLLRNYSDKTFKNASSELIKNPYGNSPEKQEIVKPSLYLKESLNKLEIPFCVASYNCPMSPAVRLQQAGLYKYFKDKIFCGEFVFWSKINPDIYLYAANKMNTLARNCVVIENNVYGILSAKMAGMYTIGYIGGPEINAKSSLELRHAGALTLFYDMRDLLYISKENLKRSYQY